MIRLTTSGKSDSYAIVLSNCMAEMQRMATPAVDVIFETSWEVCNKIGGIYTVLSTKAKALQELYKDRVIFIGPDVWKEETPSPYFKEYPSLLKNAAKNLNATLPYGIKIRVGRWDIPGNPLVVLVEFSGVYPHLDRYYGRLWERFGVDSLHAYGDYPEGCAFAIAASIVIGALTKHLKVNPRKTIAHFDEWTTAAGLLHLEDTAADIATIFTTHATSIGRSICGNNKPLYDYFKGYFGDQMARELNMESKHSLEKAAAHNADCFTTVSDVTAAECEQLLDKKPHVVTPNGFEPGFVPSSKIYEAHRKEGRKRLLDIAHSMTGRSYDEDNTFIVATSGRNEYRNKGIDLFIDSLNHLAVSESIKTDKKVLAFIMVPAWVNQPRQALKERLENGNSEKEIDKNYITHTLFNEDSDSIACRLEELKINSNANDKVTVIYLPCYLDGSDGILGISYYDMMPALDATIFPSYYEPWGYTPLESIAFGVPTISTDKAGFGQWILSNFANDFQESGCHIVKRGDSNYQESKEAIATALAKLIAYPPEEIKAIRKKAIEISRLADWSLFIKYYLEAFEIAFRHRDERSPKAFVNFNN